MSLEDGAVDIPVKGTECAVCPPQKGRYPQRVVGRTSMTLSLRPVVASAYVWTGPKEGGRSLQVAGRAPVT